jgi:hypothetical protein
VQPGSHWSGLTNSGKVARSHRKNARTLRKAQHLEFAARLAKLATTRFFLLVSAVGAEHVNPARKGWEALNSKPRAP